MSEFRYLDFINKGVSEKLIKMVEVRGKYNKVVPELLLFEQFGRTFISDSFVGYKKRLCSTDSSCKVCVYPKFKSKFNEGITSTHLTSKLIELIEKSSVHDKILSIDTFNWDKDKRIAGHIIIRFLEEDDCNDNVSVIGGIMTQCGYHFASMFKEVIDGKRCVVYQYEPLFDGTKELPLTSPFLYHVTTKNKFDKIKSKGLLPKYQCYREFSYPERVYFFTEYNPSQFIGYAEESMKRNYKFNKENKTLEDTREFIVIKIDIRKIRDKEIQFFSDPNLEWCSIFTYGYIDWACVVGVEEFNL